MAPSTELDHLGAGGVVERVRPASGEALCVSVDIDVLDFVFASLVDPDGLVGDIAVSRSLDR